MNQYVGLIHKEPGSDYGVSFPDFPGCITGGSTLAEACTMATEALSFHISGMMEDGDPIPEPSSLEAVVTDPESHDAIAVLVAVKVNINSR